MQDQKFERQYNIEEFYKKITFRTIQNIKLSLVNNFDKVNMLEVTRQCDKNMTEMTKIE